MVCPADFVHAVNVLVMEWNKNNRTRNNLLNNLVNVEEKIKACRTTPTDKGEVVETEDEHHVIARSETEVGEERVINDGGGLQKKACSSSSSLIVPNKVSRLTDNDLRLINPPKKTSVTNKERANNDASVVPERVENDVSFILKSDFEFAISDFANAMFDFAFKFY